MQASLPHPTATRRRGRPLRWSDRWWALLFLAPSLAGILVFVAGPILASIGISFTDYDGFDRFRLSIFREYWVGLDNYQRMLTDPRLLRSAGQTLLYTLVTVPATLAIALVAAVGLNKPLRGISVLRTFYFIPLVTSGVAIALTWRWIFNPQVGPINALLDLIGVSGPGWLTSSAWALPAVMITGIWADLPFATIVFLAGLQSIPHTYYEAADLDGASASQKFFHITVPLVSATTFLVLVLSLISALQVFTTVYVMTQGGPVDATNVVVHFLFEQFRFTYYGYASAIAWVLFAAIFALTLVQWRIRRRWVVYES